MKIIITFVFKLVTWEALELTFSHKHIKSATIYGTILSDRNPETSLATPTHQVNEKNLHQNE